MKPFEALVVLSSSVLCLVHAGVIQLDVATRNDEPTLKLALDLAVPVTEHDCMGAEHNHEGSAVTQNIASDTYDVKLPYQTHRGVLSDDGSYIKFANIPFAEAPLGELRFKAPVARHTNSEEVDLGENDAVCPQFVPGWAPKAKEFLECYGGALEKPPTCSFEDKFKDVIGPGDYENLDFSLLHENSTEDCLLLDVYVPKSVWDKRGEKNGKKTPVVNWIHGGGFVLGWKSQAGGPEPFLQAAKSQGKDIIYVAANYRLGLFGWLNGANFIDEGGKPNAGLHDQNLALSWIQDYIGLFGGDKSSVTVMGQSAGGSSILHHIVSGAGAVALKPNFSQAIIQSPAFLPVPDFYSMDQVYIEAKRRTGIYRGGLDALQKKSTFDLMIANIYMTFYSQYGRFKFGPAVDADYVPELPGQLLLNNTYHKGIPVILGHTALDGLLFVPPWLRDNDDVQDYIIDIYPYLPESVLETVKKDIYYGIPKKGLEISKINAVSDLLDDLAISCNNNYLTNAILKNDSSTPVWRYLFSARPAIHGSDVAFTYYPTKENPSYVIPKMAKFMQQKYVNFILNGNPDSGETLSWPQYQEKAGKPYRAVMKFGDLLAGNFSSVVTDPLKQYRCDLWQSAKYLGDEEVLNVMSQRLEQSLKMQGYDHEL